MGNCDSSLENLRLKHNSKQNIKKDYGEFPSNLSSTTLPSVSASYFNEKDVPLPRQLKKNNSTEKNNLLENKQYLLSERIAKREDITKKYKLSKKPLGDGATSLVYLGENSSNEKFAIKRISKLKITHKSNMLIKEAEICLKLNHKNIIKTYEIYEDINFINIVMELGDTDLFELIVNSPLEVIPEALAIEFLIQIFEVIDYLHNVENIVHCDIKTENFAVKFNKNNSKLTLKLIDFGNIRKKPINKERLFKFCGTKEYMAPEAFESQGFNEKVDEWAAGIIMYNMLTGCEPFTSDNDSDYRDNIRFQEINFNIIKNEKLRELNKKLLNRYMAKRISAKEALEEIKKIKNEINYNNDNIKSLKDNKNYSNIINNELSLMNI